MPNRLLKESILASETLNLLGAQEEVLFYRLIVSCDDYGRFDARPAIVRSRCFPLAVDRVSEAQVAGWLDRLEEVDLIRGYIVNGRPYLYMPTWADHQTVRAKHSKWPPPGEGAPAYADTCKHVLADAGTCPRHSGSEIRDPRGGYPPPSPPDGGDMWVTLAQRFPRYSSEQWTLIRDYWRLIQFTRRTGRVADSIIARELNYWEQFEPGLVTEALTIHTQRCADKREEYTRGIMRRLRREREIQEQGVGDNGRGAGASWGHSGPRDPDAGVGDLIIRR